MNDRPKVAPDGELKLPAKDRDGTSKSKITDVQDPLIAGDAGKAGKRRETSEPNIGEACEVRRKKDEVDLLH